MEKIRVLIVDDSVVAGNLIKDILQEDSEITVVGIARNGKEALQKVAELKPQIITMDLNMEGMDGFEAISKIMYTHPTPILVCTTTVFKEKKYIGFEALNLGALDIIEKPTLANKENKGKELIAKIKLLYKIPAIAHIPVEDKVKKASFLLQANKANALTVVAFGAATGGCTCLNRIISNLGKDLKIAILIAQQIGSGFVGGLVLWLAKNTDLKVKEARDGDSVTAGEIIVASSGANIEVARNGVIKIIRDQAAGPKPSIDRLFSSVAAVYKDNCIGVILSGLGLDGSAGIKAIKMSGGYTIAQHEKGCVAFDMPRAAIETGYVDGVFELDQIAQAIMNVLASKSKK